MKTTKEKLIAAGADLFCVHSYQGTGINDILKECNVPKGSFYNHFASKEDFALAVVEFHRESTDEFLAENLCNESLAPLERISVYIDAFNQGVIDSGFSVGCPLGTLAQEMAFLSEPLRTALNKVFQIYVDSLQECIKAGQQQGTINRGLDPTMTAMFIMSTLEGAVLMAKTYQNDDPLRGAHHLIINVILTQTTI